MTMSPSTLASELQGMTPTDSESAAIGLLAEAWRVYFLDAIAGAVPINPAALFADIPNPPGPPTACPPKAAMKSALVGMSASGAGSGSVQAGIVAFWAVLVATPALYFPGATLITPPTMLVSIAAALSVVFASNTTGKLDLPTSCTNISSVLHSNNLGGTATFPGPVISPIT